jgi:condensin complex subunit 1
VCAAACSLATWLGHAASSRTCEPDAGGGAAARRRSLEAPLRSNLIIALGDLALRFPNVLEPYTEFMYRPLTDRDASVRKNALMVLSHLILNDMMKVKGHIARLALCLEDEQPRIAALAQLFFHELAKKEYKVGQK